MADTAVDFFARLGIVSGAILAAGAVAWKSLRGLVRVWHLMRRVSEFLDDVKAAGGATGLVDRLESIEAAVNEHLAWHGHPGRRPARPVAPYTNGDRPEPYAGRRRR